MRTVAYLRVSTEDQATKGVSLEAQRAKVMDYATLYDLELAADGRALVPVPTEQATIAEACRLRADGLSLRGISAALAVTGHVARNGQPFQANQVRRILAAVPVAQEIAA